jgi:Leucine-rich repeat (LRR) protein
VTVRGQRYYVECNRILDLSGIGLTDISEIKGLESLTNLKELVLSQNQITELKGLNQLKNLQKLNLKGNQIKEIKGLENLTNLEILSLNGNQIEEIKGLEQLIKLRELYLRDNPIREDEKYLLNIGLIDPDEKRLTYIFGWINAQDAVGYCQEKARTAQEKH